MRNQVSNLLTSTAAQTDIAPESPAVLEPLAVAIEQAPLLTGVTRTRIFDAIAKNQLTVRKAGRASIIELPELRRWVRSLPTRGRAPDPPNAVPATRDNRDRHFRRTLKTASDLPIVEITKSVINAGRERRASTPAQARNFLDAMRGLFRWALEADLRSYGGRQESAA
jgi:hypothetical protein